jgi:Cu+-exporting ATPase
MTTPTSLTLSIEGMSCASCVGRVERALKAVPGVGAVSVNLASETARLSHDGSTAEIVAALARAGYPARMSEVTLRIDGMTCASCVGRVERALKAVPGVLTAEVNLATESARVRFAAGALAPADLLAAAEAAGYPAHLAEATGAAEAERFAARKDAEQRALLRDTLLAALLAAPVIVIEMGAHLVPSFHHWIADRIGTGTNWTLQFLLTTLNQICLI